MDSAVTLAPATRSPLLGRLLRRTEFYLVVVIVAAVIGLGVATPNFLTLSNFSNLANSYAVTGVLAAGLLVVLISGNIDISFAATTMVAQYLAALFALYVVGKPGFGVPVLDWAIVFAVAMTVGLGLGLVNAVIVSKFRASSIIVTIATMNLFFGLLMFFSRGKQIFNLPPYFFKGILFQLPLPDGGSFRFTIQMLALVLALLATWALLNQTAIGRQIYALGGNPEAAKRLGFGVFRLHLFVFGYLGVMAGVAAIIHAQLQQQVAPNVLVGRELDVLAAVVLGGASLLGGVGTVLGTVLGIALLAILQNGLIMVGVSSYWTQVCTGLVILVSVCITALSDRMKTRRKSRGVV
jgi:simple sugar transport system permease protein